MILRPESLERLKEALDNGENYSDQDLDNTSVLLSTIGISAVETLVGGMDSEYLTYMSANLTIIVVARLINAGLVDPVAITKFVNENFEGSDGQG